MHDAFTEQLFLFGGSDGESVALNDVWVFQLNNQSWRQLNVTGPRPGQRALKGVAGRVSDGLAGAVQVYMPRELR